MATFDREEDAPATRDLVLTGWVIACLLDKGLQRGYTARREPAASRPPRA